MFVTKVKYSNIVHDCVFKVKLWYKYRYYEVMVYCKIRNLIKLVDLNHLEAVYQ